MSTGQVKWFNNAKGFGFILPDDGGDDLFAHYSSISMEGYKTLKAGQSVSFDVIEGPKGLHAANIVPVEGESEATNSEAQAASPQEAGAAEATEVTEESAQDNSQENAGMGESAEDDSAATS